MRGPARSFVLLFVCFFVGGTPAFAQSDKPAGDQTKPAAKAASEEEVEQLRREVADLKATIQKMMLVNQQQAAPAAGHLVQASGVVADASQPADSGAAPEPAPTAADIDALQKEIDILQKKASDGPPVTAGWNGEHFYLKSSDGLFTLSPVGYLDANYISYRGDGAPPDTFSISRARFGVQGKYGTQLDYAFLFETANAGSSGLTIRDAYADFKPWSVLKFQAGQYKVPFSMEVGTADTSVEFVSRSIVSVLYPDAAGSFRAPGVDAHGDLFGGVVQYWGGVFNGRGLVANATTNEPEVVARIRFQPWKNDSNSILKDFAIGGSASHSRSKGLSNELSFSGNMNDSTYSFFPQYRINGGIERYNGFAIFRRGPLGIRAEYTQGLWKRDNIGALQVGGIAFQSLPGITGKGAYGQVTYILTGEAEPENAIPRVKHPVIGPNSPGETGGPGWGAWALKFRYSWLQGKAPGAVCDQSTVPACPLTPVIFPAQSDHTQQFTSGVNWYLNYWVLLKFDFNVDRLVNPSVQGIAKQNYFVALQQVQFRF
ncbi:MAG: porin [Candidatus Acidiferrales bacterium]